MIQIGTLCVDFAQREIRRHGTAVRIGARAFDVFEALYRAKGALVSKDELLDTVWPGMCVEENRLQVHIAALRKLLGADRELIKTVPGRGYLLVKDARSGDPRRMSDLTPDEGDAPQRAGLLLIGREGEVAQLIEQLGHVAVTTLVGAGGIGKTRLALYVAREMRERFGTATCFVELAQAASGDAVLATVAGALKLPTQQDPIDVNGVIEAITASDRLLVLDNAEHVIDAVAQFVETLVARHPAVRVLVTSREPLLIRAEAVFRVDPLTVPKIDAPVDTIPDHSAVQLFLCRVRAIAPDCIADRASIVRVAEVCRRLEGLPLAIELAAARVATLGIEGVASRLDDRLNLLTGGLRSALPRHQALRATFDWSYALLDSTSKVLLRRLGLFAGTFTFDAVCAVATEPGIPIATVIAGLGELATKSLLTVEFHGAVAQYRLTESTRAYAMEKLRDEGEVQSTAQRHMHYLQRRIEERADAAEVRRGPSLDEARAAYDWAFSAEGDAALGVALAGSLVGTLLDMGLVQECHARAQRALEVIDGLAPGKVDVVCEMRLCAAYASTVLYAGDCVLKAITLWNRVLRLARAAHDDGFEVRALWGLWNTTVATGDIHASLRYATRFQHVSAKHGAPWQRLLADGIVAISLHFFGEHDQARERLERATAEIGELGAAEHACGRFAIEPLAFNSGALARIEWLQGRPERAMQLAEQTLNLIRPESLEPSLSHLVALVAVPVALQCGVMDAAARYLDLLRSQVTLNRFEIWQDYAQCLAGQYEILAGRPAQGVAMMKPALRRLEGRSFRRLLTPVIAACAEALVWMGELEDASQQLDDTLRFCEKNGERLFLPELLRVKGVAELQRAGAVGADRKGGAARHEAAGRRILADAMAMANDQGALIWELRAALDLAGHLLGNRQLDEAALLIRDMSRRFDLTLALPEVKRLLTLDASLKDMLVEVDTLRHAGGGDLRIADLKAAGTVAAPLSGSDE